MIRKLLLFIILIGFFPCIGPAQSFVKTSDLFPVSVPNSHAGRLNIIQDPAIDTLISRYILANINLKGKYTYYGMEGYRIQIYASSNRNAREESNKARAEFINKFPDIISYQLFENPGYFKIRVGNFRSKTEATRLFLIISKEFPDAYLVPDFIEFPDLNTK
jgi:hypothetical protein